MNDPGAPKSAFEIAMARLKAKDRAEGLPDEQPLTPEQREEITRLRQEAQAKLAEIEILHRDSLRSAGGDPAKIEELNGQYRTDRERVESRLESAVRRVRESRSRETNPGG